MIKKWRPDNISWIPEQQKLTSTSSLSLNIYIKKINSKNNGSINSVCRSDQIYL